MAHHRLLSAIAWLTICLCNQISYAAEKLPSSLQIGEQRLTLNGAGVRTKTFLELYTAGLYLLKPCSDSTAIIEANEPMALRIKITSSFVSPSSLVESLEEGFKNAMGGDIRPIRPQMEQFRSFFKDEIKKGDVFDMVYLPQHGTVVNKNGKYIGAVSGPSFKRALFSIWLCDKPADNTLKQALLSAGTNR